MFNRLTHSVQSFTQPTKEHWNDLGSDLQSRLARIREHRDVDENTLASLEADFQQVLAAWGMTEADIPQVLHDLKFRVVVFLLALLPGGFLFLQGSILCAVCFAVVSLVGCVTTFWRIRVLRTRCFKPLYHKLFVSKKRS